MTMFWLVRLGDIHQYNTDIYPINKDLPVLNHDFVNSFAYLEYIPLKNTITLVLSVVMYFDLFPAVLGPVTRVTELFIKFCLLVTRESESGEWYVSV